MKKDAIRDQLLLLAFLLSGAAALGYEILWTRLLSLALGNETLGVLATLAGFFGGLALGSWWFHKPILRSLNPARLFSVLEVIAAIYIIISPHLLYFLVHHMPLWLGPIAGDNNTLLGLVCSLSFATVMLLPGTVVMGATLAALVEARRRACGGDQDGRGLGRLYAANTAGAMLGVLGTVFILLPQLGMILGSMVLAALGLSAAGFALIWSQQQPQSPLRNDTGESNDTRRWIYLTLTVTGLAGVGLEVVGLQILTQRLENTVYTFANLLAVYLVGTALGSWIYAGLSQQFAARHHKVTAYLILGHCFSVFLVAIILKLSPSLLIILAPEGSAYVQHLIAELTLAAVVLLIPTMLMGALFSHLMGQIAAGGIGRAYALNTLGATLAPFIFGLVAIRIGGYTWALYSVAVIYLLLFVLVSRKVRLPKKSYFTGLAMGLGACVLGISLMGSGSMDLVEVPQGWKRIWSREGLMGLVAVTEQIESSLPGRRINRRLQVNQQFRMGGELSFGEQRMGHIPLLFAPDAHRALFLGVGTGTTLAAVRHFPLKHVDAVELVPEVLETLPYFEHVNDRIQAQQRVHFHAADARRYVAASPDRFDVIVADLFHPARDGAGSLYALEHFETIRDHLTEGGVFAQWIALNQFDIRNLKTVVRTFIAVYPQVHSFLGLYSASTPVLVLMGRLPTPSGEQAWIDLLTLKKVLAQPFYKRIQLQEPRDLMGAYMLDRKALAAFAGEGPLNTDLNPRVLFDAPASIYEHRAEMKWKSLKELLQWRILYPSSFLNGDVHHLSTFRTEVKSFSLALTLYMQAEIDRSRGVDLQELVETYLKTYDTAPEFYPAASLLYGIAHGYPRAGKKIFPSMLARTPDNERVYREYLNMLVKLRDRERWDDILQRAQKRFGKSSFPDFRREPGR